MRTVRYLCLAYCIVLTFLLLTPRIAILLGLLRYVPHGPGGMGIHFMAFFPLGFLAAASRLPIARWRLVALLVAYALGTELLQLLCPPRVFDGWDIAENLVGLGVGFPLGDWVSRYSPFARRNAMPPADQYRILTHENLATYDTFILADPSPENLDPDRVLVVHELTGRTMTVHRSRLIPAENPKDVPLDHQRKSHCPTCGRVAGVVEDEVTCPHDENAPCGLLEKTE
ncbi:MAG TPA: VanZ family protein [Thermoguttaceae bacterium]|nr:VanZ family protein [Thermoguttaceae bacterium]